MKEISNKYSIEELEFALSSKKKEVALRTKINTTISPLKALALIEDLNLSDMKYKSLRKLSNSISKDMYPSLYSIKLKRKQILPEIDATEVSATVSLKILLEKTLCSILEMCKIENCDKKLKLVLKWGMDGSGGHSMYKQRFSNNESSDENLFLVACVPLE